MQLPRHVLNLIAEGPFIYLFRERQRHLFHLHPCLHGLLNVHAFLHVYIKLELVSRRIKEAVTRHAEQTVLNELPAYFGERDHGFRLNVISESGGR
jgi:hypothetical protein